MSGSDLNNMVSDLGRMKVDQLKSLIKKFNDSLSMHLRVSGVKAELYARCRSTIYDLAALHDKTRFNIAKRCVSEARDSNGSGYSPSSSSSYGGGGGYNPPAPAPAPRYQPPQNYNPPPAYKPPLPPPRFQGYGGQGVAATASGSGSGSGSGVYNQNGAAVPPANQDVPLLFRSNPFYKVEKSLCGVTTLPKAGQGDRKSVVTNFALTEPQRTALANSKASLANPQYQVRLYCTNEDYFNPHRPSNAQTPAPIDFPATCEIKLNYVNVPANTKGIKKQVGTASPVDLAKGGKLDITAGAINRLEVIYVNTEKVNSRRYFMVVYLVEVTTIKQLADRVKNGKQRSKEEVIQSVIKMNSDPDMEASSFGVSLKDPLTLSRIKTPIRSSACTHISCFDAEVWFMMNEQTPTWTCPICSKVLRVEDLVHDNFFADVLKTIGSTEVDAITIEPDGTWRSDNDKFGTAQPKSTVPSRATSVKPDISGYINGSATGAEGSAVPEGKGKGKTEALTLDSDDDDDDQPLAKRQRLNGLAGGYGRTISIDSSPAPGAYRPSSAAGGAAAAPRRMDTIDLTLSDSDDDRAPPRVPTATAPAAPAIAHQSAYVPPPVPRAGSVASSSDGAGAAVNGANGTSAINGTSGVNGTTGATSDEALRRQLADQAQRRQVEDLRRRREEEGRGSAGDRGDDAYGSRWASQW